LQVALEQGMPALLAVGGACHSDLLYTLGALRIADRSGRVLLMAGCASLATLLVHGLFDAELYVSTLGGLTFFAPAALLWSAAAIYATASEVQSMERPSQVVSGSRVALSSGW
jgi:hypothetical protein